MEDVEDNQDKIILNVGSLSTGVYVVRMENANIVTTKKFIKL